MTAEEVFQHELGFGLIGNNVSITLTKRDIYRAMEAYASQQRTDGIREGFEAAREINSPSLSDNLLKYQTADDYINSK